MCIPNATQYCQLNKTKNSNRRKVVDISRKNSLSPHWELWRKENMSVTYVSIVCFIMMNTASGKLFIFQFECFVFESVCLISLLGTINDNSILFSCLKFICNWNCTVSHNRYQTSLRTPKHLMCINIIGYCFNSFQQPVHPKFRLPLGSTGGILKELGTNVHHNEMTCRVQGSNSPLVTSDALTYILYLVAKI